LVLDNSKVFANLVKTAQGDDFNRLFSGRLAALFATVFGRLRLLGVGSFGSLGGAAPAPSRSRGIALLGLRGLQVLFREFLAQGELAFVFLIKLLRGLFGPRGAPPASVLALICGFRRSFSGPSIGGGLRELFRFVVCHKISSYFFVLYFL
jgi:hypothetical protein